MFDYFKSIYMCVKYKDEILEHHVDELIKNRIHNNNILLVDNYGKLKGIKHTDKLLSKMWKSIRKACQNFGHNVFYILKSLSMDNIDVMILTDSLFMNIYIIDLAEFSVEVYAINDIDRHNLTSLSLIKAMNELKEQSSPAVLSMYYRRIEESKQKSNN